MQDSPNINQQDTNNNTYITNINPTLSIPCTNSKRYKKHGFYPPYPWQQIITWIFFISNTVCFVLCPLLLSKVLFSIKVYIILTCVFAISSIGVAALTIISTVIDPCDHLYMQEMKKKKQCKTNNIKYNMEFSNKDPICILCRSNIKITSKHCKKCDKCIEEFDHHCNWLNNCVGKDNYIWFYVLLLFLILYLSYNVSICCIMFFNGRNLNKKTFKSITCVVVGVVDLVIEGNLIYLFIVHTWLRCKGMTTYDYIVQKEEKEIIKKEQLKRKQMQSEAVNENEKEENDNDNDPNNKSEDVQLKEQIQQCAQKMNTFVDDINSLKNFHSFRGVNTVGSAFSSISPPKVRKGGTRKGRNKIMLSDIIEKHEKNQKKCYTTSGTIGVGVTNGIVKNADRVIIDDEYGKENIFKPIVDEIYYSKTIKDNQSMSTDKKVITLHTTNLS